MRFQIVTIQPAGYLHSRCFEEVAELLELSLRDLGHEAVRTVNRLHPENLNLLLGYHLLPDPEILKGARFGIYQLEHLSALPDWLQTRSLAMLQKAVLVWDYSEVNRQWLQEKGIASTLVVPGYHPKMQKIVRDSHPEIDLLFYGAVTKRREAILNKISAVIPRLKILEGVYGVERDIWISRSKAVINLHSYDRPLYEAVRLSYLLNNRCVIISEQSEGIVFEGLPSISFDESRLEKLEGHLRDEKRLIEVAEHDALHFSEKYPMVQILNQVLGK